MEIITMVLDFFDFLLSQEGVLLLLEGAGIFIGLWVIIRLIRFAVHALYRIPVSFRKTILLVMLPKDAAREKSSKEPGTPMANLQTLHEKIGVAETFFSSIGGLRAQRGIKAWILGREDHISFEIVSHKGLISFYIAAPFYLQKHIEEQVHAQYPEAHIEEVSDYNIFSPKGVILGSYLKFTRSYFFPLKTYKKLESDPMSAITNSLSQLQPDEGAAIQYIVRSAKESWHKWGRRVASEMHQGKKLHEALRAASANPIFKVFHEIVKLFGETAKSREARMQAKQDKEQYKLSPLEEEMVKGLEEKTAKAGMDVNIRIIVSAKDKHRCEILLEGVINAFNQVNIYEYGNSLHKTIPEERKVIQRFFYPWFAGRRVIHDFIFRNYRDWRRILLNTEEMASVFHFPLPTTETPNIRWLMSKKAAPPVNVPTEGMLLGRNIYRGKETPIRIKLEDRRRHVYTIGMTGTGKSNILSSMAIQDIKNGEGVCIIDPHGSLVDDVLEHVPKERADDVIYFDPSDVERPMGLNMLEIEGPEQMDFAVQEMIAIFYKLVTDPSMIGPMFEHNMRNAMLTLMADKEYPGTIAEIPRIFTDAEFQKYKLTKVTDPMVRAFWEKEMAKTSDFHKSEMLGYLISKVGRFVENEMIRNIIGQPKSAFNLRDIMDKKKILLVNLSKGKVGEVNSNLLGLIIVSKLQMAALSRADMPEKDRNDFYLYIDEFQNFITDSISTILAEARKYRLDLIMAHQYIGQLVHGGGVEGKQGNTKTRDAVFGNVGTIVTFRVGPEDAEFLAKQFAPVFGEYDLINIAKYNAYVRLLIDNQVTRPFNMETYPPMKGNSEIAQAIKQLSRLKYGRDRRIVDAEIIERTRLGESTEEAENTYAEKTL